MSAYPVPAPESAFIGGKKHGERITHAEAVTLAGLADFPEDWVIVPEETGEGLRLMWGDACTIAELGRALTWNEATLAEFEASRGPNGSA